MRFRRMERMRKRRKIRRQTIINGGKLLLFLLFLVLSVYTAVVHEQYPLATLFFVIAAVIFGMYFR